MYSYFQMRRLIATEFQVAFDDSILNLTFHPTNKSHLGEVILVLFKDIESIRFKIQMESKQLHLRFATFELDACQFAQEQKENWMMKIVVNILADILDMSAITCPMRTGKYVLRRKQKFPSLEFPVPVFIPLNENGIGKLIVEARPIKTSGLIKVLEAQQTFKFVHILNDGDGIIFDEQQ